LGWAVAALVLTVSATVFLLFKNEPSGTVATSSPGLAARAVAEVPLVPFTDVTTAAGIKFTHENGAYGAKWLPETMGSGVGFLDFDNDRDQDLLFVNSTQWPDRTVAGQPAATAALYRNDGGGHFTDVTTGSGLDVPIYGMGVAVGDYDNDGRSDVFITAVGGNRLFRNEGAGKFRDVTSEAAVGGSADNWSTSAAWVDYDNDGKLDLFVCNYVQWSRETDLKLDYKLAGIGRAYGPPMKFEGTFPYLYHNEGNGRFADVSAAAGVQVKNPDTGAPLAKALGVAPVDIDNDGWIDLIVANDTVQNFVFRNEQNGTFKEIGEVSGAAFDSYGKVRGAMGIDAARFQDDNSLAVSIGNFANEMTALYVSQKDALTFTDESILQGIGFASRQSLTFGVFFFDYDLDGALDLLTTNGHLEERISEAQPGQQYRQPAQLFWNARRSSGAKGFTPVPLEKSGAALFQPIVGRGSAFGDIDGDGDLDVVFTQNHAPAVLLRNDQALDHHFVRFQLIGSKSNHDAIGAWLKVRTPERTSWRRVMPTRGYMSQSELPVTIGLGKETRVEEVSVTWPGGAVQKVNDVRIDAVNEVLQTD
jgi:hypothetical protein